MEKMDEHSRKQAKTTESATSEVVSGEKESSIEWEFITMTEQEEDLVCRIHRLVGDRWDLIAGRIPGRKAEEIERFWTMRHGEMLGNRRKEEKPRFS